MTSCPLKTVISSISRTYINSCDARDEMSVLENNAISRPQTDHAPQDHDI